MNNRIIVSSVLAFGLCLTSALGQVGTDGKPIEAKPQSDDAKAIIARLEGIERMLQKVVDQQNALRQQADILQREIEELRNKLAAGPVTAKKPDEPAAAAGKLVFDNQHASMSMDVQVNGQLYRVAPGTNKTIMLAPGKFTYKVLQTDPDEKLRELKAGEVKTITMK